MRLTSTTPKRRVTLFEGQDWCVLTPEIFDGLKNPELIRKSFELVGVKLQKELRLRSNPIQFREIGKNRLEIKVNGIAGTFTIGRLSLVIAPKFAVTREGSETWVISSLLLMRNAKSDEMFFSRSRDNAISKNLTLELLAMSYVAALKNGMKGPFIQSYKTFEQISPVLRGQINIQRQLKTVFTLPHLVNCDENRLDVENQYNSVLKMAAVTCLRHIKNTDVKRRLRDLDLLLPGVAQKLPSAQISALRLPPQYESWNEAFEIAKTIARGASHSTSIGSTRSYSFLFNMEKLFERFVEQLLANSLEHVRAYQLTSRRQVSTRYANPLVGSRTGFYSKPDNVLFDVGRPLIVVDAKYKRLSDNLGQKNRKPISADAYELIAAMTAQGCKTGLLVYPKVIGDDSLTDGELKIWSVPSFGCTLLIGAIAVNLNGLRRHSDLEEMYKYFGTIIEQLMSLSNTEDL